MSTLSPWRKVVKRKRTLSGSCWLHLECGHLALRRGQKADERPAKLRCHECQRPPQTVVFDRSKKLPPGTYD